jgi:hypothetical protein
VSTPGIVQTATRPQIQARAAKFVKEWSGETRERAEKDTFWNEFFSIFGVNRRRVGTFEYLAKRHSTGNHGFIDLFLPGELAVEHKSSGGDLDAALDQAVDYLILMKPLDQPHTVVVCDFNNFLVHDLETGIQNRFPLEDLTRHIERFDFLAGYSRREVHESEEEANLEATRLLSDLHDALKANGYDDHALRVFLVRILYILFADDTGVWARNLFHDWLLVHTKEDGSDLGARLIELFSILDTPHSKRAKNLDEDLREFAYVNGGVFEETIRPPHCDSKMRDTLVSASRFEWNRISPVIFGSLFQNVMEEADRRTLGAHFTSEQDILRTIRPLFLDDLEARLAKARSIGDRRDQLKALRAFRDMLPTLTFFDPACGVGNFLMLAYRELRRVELECLLAIRESEAALTSRRAKGKDKALPGIGQGALDVSLESKVTVGQFYGIEIEEFPVRIAETAIHLVDHQANLALSEAFGDYYVRLPITDTAHVRRANALHIDCTYLLGNPPFAGHKKRTGAQTDDMKAVWGKAYYGYMDFVTSWYVKAAEYVGVRNTKIAFVSTNSISQGEPVAPLWEPLFDAGFTVDFAHRTFLWRSEAKGPAAVHVVIVGWSQGKKPGKKPLFEYVFGGRGEPTLIEASNINGYLVDAENVFVRSRSQPLSGLLADMHYGSMAGDGGWLLVSPEEYPDLAADPHASKYLRPFIGARELIHSTQKWCLWMQEVDPKDIQASPLLRERIEGVKAYREEPDRDQELKDAASRPATFLRNKQPSAPYLAIPRHVAESRPYFPLAHFDPEVVAGDHNFVAEDPDGYAFALMSSSMFITWMRGIAGRIRADLRFSKTLAWNAFPVPDVDDKTRQAIIDAGKQVLAARSHHPGRSLADLYDPLAMPADVLSAHQALDKLVNSVLAGRRKVTTEAERLSALLDQYAQMIRAGQLAVEEARPRRRRKT